MEFVVDNYLWFLIGGIVLLMIIIGYFAEKTNFGKLPLNNKKKQEEKTEEQATPEEPEIKLDEIGIADALAPEENLNVFETVEEAVSDNNVEEDLNVPFGDVDVPVSEELASPSEATEEVAAISEVPNMPEVVEANEETAITDEAEDDVWKF